MSFHSRAIHRVSSRGVLLAFVLFTTNCGGTISEKSPSALPQNVHLIQVNCADNQITVDPTEPHGVDHAHAALLICPDEQITWVDHSGKYKFQVDFDDYPFAGAPQSFNNANPTTPKFPKGVPDITVFKYKITVDDGSGNPKPFDPHVIGGGGIPIQ